jgi:hypothetical protein
LASVTSSPCAQKLLAGAREAGIAHRVAANPHLGPEVAAMLAAGRHEKAVSWALRLVEDEDLLLEALREGPVRHRPWALRNPRTPVDILADAMGHGDQPAAQCAAAANPNTPEEMRRAHITSERVGLIIRADGNPVNRSSRAYTLVKANRWMLETPEAWPVAIRTALLCLHDIDAETVGRLAEGGAGGYAKRHPSTLGMELHRGSNDELIAFGIPAVDEYLCDERRLQPWELATFSTRERWQRLTPAHQARLYGTYREVFLESYVMRRPFGAAATTDQLAAAWIEPSMLYMHETDASIVAAIRNIEATLGESEEAWRLFIAMLSTGSINPELSWERRSEAARRLIHSA